MQPRLFVDCSVLVETTLLSAVGDWLAPGGGIKRPGGQGGDRSALGRFRMFVLLGVHPPEPAVFQDVHIHSDPVLSRFSPVAFVTVLPWSGSFLSVRPCRRCTSKVVCCFVVLQRVYCWVVWCPTPPPLPSMTFRTTSKPVWRVLISCGGPQRTRSEQRRSAFYCHCSNFGRRDRYWVPSV